MSSPSGFLLGDRLSHGSTIALWRARDQSSNRDVILALPESEADAARVSEQLRRGYELARQLDLPQLLRPLNLIGSRGGDALILEDPGAQPLFGLKVPLTTARFLTIARSTTEALTALHGAGYIHRQLDPWSILTDATGSKIWLTSLGRATRLSRSTTQASDPTRLDGRLPYISPEQTGRMNRSVDARSDLYSLGVCFYALLTGAPPFEAMDAMQWVHAHIARTPPNPRVRNAAVPPALSAILLKLLSKNPEERYQSAAGLLADLDLCQVQLDTTGGVTDLEVGTQDVSAELKIPERIYGRDDELEKLHAAFARAADGEREVVLLHGPGGIGKSALIGELHRPMIERGGLLIAGKSDQFKRDIPYFSVIRAFQELVRQLLTEPEAQLEQWRERIQTAVGNSGRLITDIIPEVEIIIGPQPDLRELNSAEARNRFHLVFNRFLQSFASPDHPLVLFLDDLQWVDLATLELLNDLLTTQATQNFLLLGAYRPGDTPKHDALAATFERIKAQGTNLSVLQLAPLSGPATAELIADAIDQSPSQVESLARAVTEKTGGNPFFVGRFLQTLAEQELLSFDGTHRKWVWDLDAISEADITDNVVDLMAGRIQRLPQQTQDLIQLAACVGNRFNLATLATVREAHPAEVAKLLWPALEADLILPVGDGYLRMTGEAKALTDAETISFRFVHDRVQEAAYSLVDPERRARTHLSIGRLLLRDTSPYAWGERVFEIVNHWNRALRHVTEPIERIELARLNLTAGARARASSAYAPALTYFEIGISLLPVNGWQIDYELALDLHASAADAALLTSEFARGTELADTVLSEARAVLDRVRAHAIRIEMANNQLRMDDAVLEALSVLDLLGYPVLPPTSPADFEKGMQSVLSTIAGRSFTELRDLEELPDAEAAAAVGLIARLLPTAGIAAPHLFGPLCFRALEIAFTRGVTPATAAVMSAFGNLLCCIGMYDMGYEFGQLAQHYRAQFTSSADSTMVVVDQGVFVTHWKDHARDSLRILERGIQESLEVGNLFTYGFCINQAFDTAFYVGEPLAKLDADYPAARQTLMEHKQELSLMAMDPWGQAVANLRGRAADPAHLVGDRFHIDQLLPIQKEKQLWMGVFLATTPAIMLAYLFGRPLRALALAQDSTEQVLTPPSVGMFCFPMRVWYTALAALDALPPVGDPDRAVMLNQAAEARKHLVTWSQHAPQNHEHRLTLLDAELARVDGRTVDAMEAYDRSARQAAQNGFIQDEALAHERAASFHHAASRWVVAKSYAHEAARAYGVWGATAKVDDIYQRYPTFFDQRPDRAASASTLGLDLQTVLKASEALTSEIRLERLLERMMKLLLENAGAQRAVLLIPSENGLLVQAEGDADSGQVRVMRSRRLEDTPNLPASLIRFAVRTRQDVLLGDALHEGRFTRDPVVRQQGIRSVLCTPLYRQDDLRGVVYLDNNLSAHAFTRERVELLRLLSTQAATSIENATLYTELHAKAQELELNNERLTELDRMREEFLANTSHELRTPLNGIIGIAQSMIDGATGELNITSQKNLGMVVSSGRRLSNLVNDLLDFSALSRRTLSLNTVPMELSGLVDLVVQLSLPLVHNKPIQVVADIPADLPPVCADDGRLQQVLHNLVGNAIKFTEKGSVTVRARVHDAQVRVDVQDTGIGIRKEVQDRIFESFQQADSSTQRHYGGTGIGLAVARQLVMLHGGTIGVESTPGVGSTFWFTLPIDQSGEAPRTTEAEAFRRPVEQDALFAVAEEGSADGLTVLVVDDEPVNLQVLVNQLGSQGYNVVTAVSGIEALERVEAGLRPDLVVLDVMMPTMSGYEVCQRLRQRFPAAEMPVLMLTAKQQTSDLLTGLQVGANDYVTKPFSSPELSARIKTHISLAKVHHAVGRFVPIDFLRLLGRDSIVDVQLGDNIELEMSILFSDIRSFTRMSEQMSPEENFRFINEYLGYMEPAVLDHHGVIDKYIGDAVMALYNRTPDDAVRSGIDMLHALARLNRDRALRGAPPVRSGIGVNTGRMRLGTLGGDRRMDTTVISDAVNLAARVEGLTKHYEVNLLITQHTLDQLREPEAYRIRLMDKVTVKGKAERVTIFEVYDADEAAQRDAKDATRDTWETAVRAYHEGELSKARAGFEACLQAMPADRPTLDYLGRCRKRQIQLLSAL